MDSPDPLSLEGLEVSVAETPDAVTYAFVPHFSQRPAFPLNSTLLFVVLPLGLLGLLAYAFDATRGTRPEWELILTGVFATQLVVWLAVGTGGFVWRAVYFWRTYRRGTTLVFTSLQVRHAGDVVCELPDLRGLRVFVFPSDDVPDKNASESAAPWKPGSKPKAALSLLIGEEGYTHGLLAGFDVVELRRLADDIHRRLAAFRHSQGMMASLQQLEVVETTSKDAASQQHTRPPTGRGGVAIALLNFGMLVFTNPIVSTIWCVPMLAGLYASGRLILAGGLGWWFLAGHVVLVFLHGIFLLGALGSFGPAELPGKEEDAK